MIELAAATVLKEKALLINMAAKENTANMLSWCSSCVSYAQCGAS